MWNAWTAPPGALPRDYDPWSCEAHCARCGELAQDCHCDKDEDEMSEQAFSCPRCGDVWEVPPTTSGRCVCVHCGHEWDFDADALAEFDPPIPDEEHHDIDDRTR